MYNIEKKEVKEMTLSTYEVKFRVDGKTTSSIYVEAKDPGAANRVALGKIQGQAGYVGRRISILTVRKIG